MELNTLSLGKRRITVSVNHEIYSRIFEGKKVNKSQIVEKALEKFYQIQLKKQVIAFCSMKDESDIEDVELALPAQSEVLDYE